MKGGINMNDILSWLTLIISAVSTLCTLVLSWILFKKEQNKTYLKERYELVIFPIVNLLEEHLYKKEITSEIKQAVEKCEDIIADNKLIAGGKLSYVFSLPLDKINFQSISKLVDKEYDDCCSALGIPLRPLDKKMYTYKTRNIKVLILGITKYSMPLIAVFLLSVILIVLFEYFFLNG